MEGIGFIGLGTMGRPMALNLIKAGHGLTVYARRPAAIEPLLKAGARAASSPAEVAKGAVVIFTVVTATADVEEVICGQEGIIQGARPGAVVVDMSTISPASTRILADRLASVGVEMLDAPVSGGEVGAKEGSLSIMVGGKEEVFKRVLPLLSCLGKRIVHIGPSGAGQVAKACNQMVLLLTLQGLAEAFTFARASEIDPRRVSLALAGGMAASRMLEVMGERMIERDYHAGVEARLHYKDIQIVLDEAAKLGLALPGSALVTQFFNGLIGRGGGREDSSQLIEIIEALSKARS